MVKSYDIKIDDEPYMYHEEGIVLGNGLVDPAPTSQLGSAIIENVSNGLGPFVNRGNGYVDANRLIPTVEGQLIFAPTAQVGAAFTLSGSTTYTPGIFHHPTPIGQYIALGTRIYRLNLTDFAGLTYTIVASSDCTASPISNAAARYTGGAFVWRDRIYFGIENSANGQAIGFAYVDFIANTLLAVIVSSTDLGFSYGAASRGRLFIAQNQAAPNHIRLKWSPAIDVNYDAMVLGTNIFGDTTTSGGTFIYGIETRPRVTWVLMMGSAALFFRADGSVLASDEAGFVGIATPRSQSSGTEDNTQGFGAVHYLDGAAYPVFAGGPHHMNPVTLLTRSLAPSNVQDIPLDAHDSALNVLYAVGEHLFMAGGTTLYDLLWSKQQPIAHQLIDLNAMAAAASYVPGALTQQGGILAVTMFSSALGRFQQMHLEVLPSMRVSTAALVAGSVDGTIDFGLLLGPERATTMTKVWLQVRGTWFNRAGTGNEVRFSNAEIDGLAVSIETITAEGPFAARITATPASRLIGRSLSFTMTVHCANYTGYAERVYMPISADFLWAPDADQDYVTLTVLATAEQATNVGGVLQSRSARQVADALINKQGTIVSVVFSDGEPNAAVGATWSCYVEKVEASGGREASSGYGSRDYIVKLLCRRMYS